MNSLLINLRPSVYDAMSISQEELGYLTDCNSLEDFLSPNENLAYKKLTSLVRQRTWFMGRLVLKKLVNKVVYGSKKKLNEIEIFNKACGQPYVKEALYVSITHKSDLAMAAVSASNEIGIDYENMKPVSGLMQRYYMTEEEIRSSLRVHGDKGLIISWTIKEAAFKAIDDGLKRSLSDLQIKFVDTESSHVFSTNGDRIATVFSSCDEDSVFSCAILGL